MFLLLENGARRGAQVRCPACTRFNAPGVRCPECGCGPIPPERYGAARMLLSAGVDRYALAERVALLEPALASQLEGQYAAQWARVRHTLVQLRPLAQDLLLPGFEDAMEDRWARLLPWSESLPWPEAPLQDSLEALHENSPLPDVRQVVALAALSRGQTSSRAMLSTALSCLYEDGRFGLEAALALTRWRVWPRLRLWKEQRERIERQARAILSGFPEQSARAAVAWVRATGREPEVDILLSLREGLRHPDADVRFECALCLEDEAGLLAALDSLDPERVAEARRRLASLGSSRLLERLRWQGDADFARDVVRRLPTPPPPGALETLLAVSSQVEGGLARELHAWVQGQPFAGLPPEDQDRWAAWARGTLSRLSAEDALRFLDWAGAADTEARRSFVTAAAEALAREAPAERARHINDAFFVRFLAVAGPEELPLLHAWAREEACAEPLLEMLVSLPGRLDRWEEPSRGRSARLLMAVWEGGARERLLPPLAAAVKSWSGITGREELIDAVWQRFQEHPEEREDLLAAFAPWRRELWERQTAAEADPVARFEAWWRVDAPTHFPELVGELVRDAPEEALPRRLAPVWAAAEARVDAWPRSTSLAVSWAAAALSGPLRGGNDALAPQAERFLSWFPGFEQRVLAAPPADGESSYHRHFLEDIHVDVKLMRESLDRLREVEEQRREAEERARRAELERRVAESRRRDLERQAEAARREAERMREELERQLAPPVQTVAPVSLWPQVPARPVDDEVILPEARLRTLMDYVRLLKTMSVSANVLEVFAAHGLTVASWTAESTAWGQAMVKRPELGLRFGELMAAPWA